MIRNLNKLFPNANGTKTFAGAQKRLDKATEYFADDYNFATAVVLREDGTYIAVAILGADSSYLAGHFAHQNVCVTNAI